MGKPIVWVWVELVMAGAVVGGVETVAVEEVVVVVVVDVDDPDDEEVSVGVDAVVVVVVVVVVGVVVGDSAGGFGTLGPTECVPKTECGKFPSEE